MDTRQTPEQAIEAARKAGFDLDLIDTNLALSVKERWRQHNMALDLMLKFERARIARDTRLPRSA